MVAVTLSPWTVGMPKDVLAKLYLPINILLLGMFAEAAFLMDTTGPAPGNRLPFSMWFTQLPIATVFVLLNFRAVAEGGKPKTG